MPEQHDNIRRTYDRVAKQYMAALSDELARVIHPDGPLLVSFHTGTEVRHLDVWFDEPVDIDFHFLQNETVVAVLRHAGFTVEAVIDRVAYPHEAQTHRTYVLARRHRPR